MANPFPFSAPDWVNLIDADPMGALTTSEAINVAQDCYHWLLTLPGTNPDDETRGVGIEAYLSGTLDALNGLPAVIEADFIKDARIREVACTPIQLQADGSYLISVSVTLQPGLVLPLTYQYTQQYGLTPIS